MLGETTTDGMDELRNNPLVTVLLDNAGFTGVELSSGNKEIAVNQIMVHEVLLKRKREVKDIRGIETMSLASFLKYCPSLCKQVFPSAAEFIIKPEIISSQITLMEGETLNSNKNRNAFLWLHQYIEKLGQSSNTIGNVINFRCSK